MRARFCTRCCSARPAMSRRPRRWWKPTIRRPVFASSGVNRASGPNCRAEVATVLNDLSARHPEKRDLRLRALFAEAYTFDEERDWPRARLAYERVLVLARELYSRS